MTTAHPRDPRLRRQGLHSIDASAAAVRLEVAAEGMRAALTAPEPEPTPEEWAATSATLAEVAPELVDGFDAIAAEHIAAAVQLGTVGPPLTAQEFADALGPIDEVTILTPELAAAVAECPPPASVAVPVTPSPPTSAYLDEPTPQERLLAEVVRRERSESNARALDWASRHDARSLEYGVRAVLTGSAPMANRLWPVGAVLDQGAEGACVGFGVADAVNAFRAGDVDLDALDALALYKRAQKLDEVPGEDYAGTSVLAGMQAGVEAGLFGGYRWAFGTRDIAQAVLQVGPVVIGVPWLSGMYETGPGGLVEVKGDDRGDGHCLVVVGIRLTGPQGQAGPYFVWLNSWGPSYGDGGLGYVHHRDLAQLLHGTGEAAIPMAQAQ